jgi:hypothetical protein
MVDQLESGSWRDENEPPRPDGEVSIRQHVETLWAYRRVIAAAMLSSTVLFILLAIVLYVITPEEREASIRFRLLFDGAAQGRYPNEMRFSADEIVSGPVLAEVYRANELQRFGEYQDFKETLFVLASNPELELLAYEYQSKLSDPKLTPVDRVRIEEEFRKKRESSKDPLFSINLRRSERFKSLPPDLMEKTLNDVLATWARQADQNKGATRYNVPVLSRNVLKDQALESEDYLIAVDILRVNVRRLIETVGQLEKLPGAKIFRVGAEQISLPEVRTNLQDLLRFELTPLIGIIRSEGIATRPRSLLAYAENQLFQAQQERNAAAGRIRTLETVLSDYSARRSRTADEAKSEPRTGGARGPLETQALIPQVSESFLDRLVELSTETQNSEVQYRQRLTDQIVNESGNLPGLELEAAFYENLASAIRMTTFREPTSREAVSFIKERYQKAFTAIGAATDRIIAIYNELSARNLNPSTHLYAVTQPFAVRTQRSLAFATVVLYYFFVITLTLIIAPIGALIHHAFRRPQEPARSRPAVSERSQAI